MNSLAQIVENKHTKLIYDAFFTKVGVKKKDSREGSFESDVTEIFVQIDKLNNVKNYDEWW